MPPSISSSMTPLIHKWTYPLFTPSSIHQFINRCFLSIHHSNLFQRTIHHQTAFSCHSTSCLAFEIVGGELWKHRLAVLSEEHPCCLCEAPSATRDGPRASCNEYHTEGGGLSAAQESYPQSWVGDHFSHQIISHTPSYRHKIWDKTMTLSQLSQLQHATTVLDSSERALQTIQMFASSKGIVSSTELLASGVFRYSCCNHPTYQWVLDHSNHCRRLSLSLVCAIVLFLLWIHWYSSARSSKCNWIVMVWCFHQKLWENGFALPYTDSSI